VILEWEGGERQQEGKVEKGAGVQGREAVGEGRGVWGRGVLRWGKWDKGGGGKWSWDG